MEGAEKADQLFDLALIELGLMTPKPAFLTDLVAGVQDWRQTPQVLAGMIQIDDLKGAGKMEIGKVPDPCGAVAHHHLLFGATPAAIPGFEVNALAKLAGRLHRAGIGGGVRIAEGIAFLIPSRLGKHAAQFDLARVGGLSIHFAGAALRLFFDHGDSGGIHLHLQDGNGFSQDHRQIQ